MVIAAKNEGTEELVSETADLLYHVLVLLVEKGIPYEAITEDWHVEKVLSVKQRIGRKLRTYSYMGPPALGGPFLQIMNQAKS